MNFSISPLSINGVFKLDYESHEELRGNIWTTFIDSSFCNLADLSSLKFNHDKFSVSNFNVFRGFHGDYKSYKLVTCVYGSIDQYVFDNRKGSKNYGELIRVNISREDYFGVLIPPGCGNAYYVKSDQAVYHYKLSYSGDYVDSDGQFTIKWYDELIRSNFPNDFSPITSERDS